MAMENNMEQDPKKSGATPPDLVFWGIIALLGAALMVASQFFVLDSYMPWIVLALGVAMLIWGMVAKSVGGLIPGGIVTGIGLGLTIIGTDQIDAGDGGEGLFLIFLALGFLSIPFTTRIFAGHMHWWAFIPGGIIALLGLALIYGGPLLQMLNLAQLVGALALAIFGAWLIYQAVKRDK
jgi:hypothetical protein